MTSQEARDALIEQATWALIEWDTDTADRGVSDEHYRDRRADVERVFDIIAGYRKHPEPEIADHVQRFAEGAAAQFRSDLDYDGAEIKRRILMDAHLIAADHPGEGEPCPVCKHDDRLDDTDNEGNR